MKYFFIILTGAASGFAASAGLYALITALSLLPRMADKTRTASCMRLYEDCVFFGGVTGCICYFLGKHEFSLSLPPVCFACLDAISGFCMGIFVGTLAISLAESLDVTAVFARRTRLHQAMAWIILSFAIGKIIGSFLFFYQRFYPFR